VKLLLDTHAFIWWDGDQAKRSEVALVACQSRANTLHLSLASVWELQIKMQLGKIALRLPLADVLRDQQQQNGLLLEVVTLEDARSFGTPTNSPRPIRPRRDHSGQSGRLSSCHPRFRAHRLLGGGALVNWNI
jgi:PIN domain nuclease of toxin-antitoxin system